MLTNYGCLSNIADEMAASRLGASLNFCLLLELR